MSTDPIIRTEKLTKTYIKGGQPIHAIRDIDLAVDAGEFVAINGPSGSGKTTLLFALAGLIQPTSGVLAVAGRQLQDQSPAQSARFRAAHIGFVFQTFYLVPYLTAVENVRLAQRAAGTDDGGAEAAKLLTGLGLGDRLRHYPTELSAGEQQRVALARAVINRPKLLLGDEPTGNLDQARGREILELIGQFNKQGGTVVLVTHSDLVGEFAGRRLNLVDGRLE
jgi:putative ABC transport system ATP-binding protein